MRDPKRIPKVLAKVQELWEKYPDERLLQLLINAAGTVKDVGPAPNLFYVEDDLLQKGVDNRLE